MTIYIPVSVEKELPEVNVNSTFILRNSKVTIFASLGDENRLWSADGKNVYAINSFSHWLKPIEVESLILHVQNDIASQRGDIKTIISESIKQFLK